MTPLSCMAHTPTSFRPPSLWSQVWGSPYISLLPTCVAILWSFGPWIGHPSLIAGEVTQLGYFAWSLHMEYFVRGLMPLKSWWWLDYCHIVTIGNEYPYQVFASLFSCLAPFLSLWFFLIINITTVTSTVLFSLLDCDAKYGRTRMMILAGRKTKAQLFSSWHTYCKLLG